MSSGRRGGVPRFHTTRRAVAAIRQPSAVLTGSVSVCPAETNTPSVPSASTWVLSWAPRTVARSPSISTTSSADRCTVRSNSAIPRRTRSSTAARPRTVPMGISATTSSVWKARAHSSSKTASSRERR